jgi:hypothetical protein
VPHRDGKERQASQAKSTGELLMVIGSFSVATVLLLTIGSAPASRNPQLESASPLPSLANTPLEPSSLKSSAPVVQPVAAEPAVSTASDPELMDSKTTAQPTAAPTASVAPSLVNPQWDAPRDVTKAEVTCRGSASYSAGAGPDVRVTRRGYLDEINPLRHATHVHRMQVLQVSIAGKTATAYGPGFQAMHRGPAPKQLEQTMDAAITWGQALGTLPSMIVIVAEDGPEVIARLQFQTCAASAPSKPPTRYPAKARELHQERREAAPRRALPRGAIQ